MSTSRIHLAVVAFGVSSSYALFAIAGHGEQPRARAAVAARADGASHRRAEGLQRKPVMPASPTTNIVASFDPAKAWNDLGCIGCHGDDGAYSDEIADAIGKPADQVARWIRNAPTIDPGTEMPYFGDKLDEPNSVALARWVQDLARHRK